MKVETMSPAQAAYESFSRSFDIRDNRDRPPSIVHGPIPWDDLKAPVRRRWELAASAALDVVTRAIPARETFQCGACGARMMKGENHDCDLVQRHNRQRGDHVPAVVREAKP
jgi:hypothetical protein